MYLIIYFMLMYLSINIYIFFKCLLNKYIYFKKTPIRVNFFLENNLLMITFLNQHYMIHMILLRIPYDALCSESFCRFNTSRWIWRKHSVLQKEREKISTRGHSSFWRYSRVRVLWRRIMQIVRIPSLLHAIQVSRRLIAARICPWRARRSSFPPFGLSAGSLRQGPVRTRRETSYARETERVSTLPTPIYTCDLSSMNLFSQFP